MRAKYLRPAFGWRSGQANASKAGRWVIAVAVFALCLVGGCGRESKMQQIQRGVEDVSSHAKEIEDAAQASDGRQRDRNGK